VTISFEGLHIQLPYLLFTRKKSKEILSTKNIIFTSLTSLKYNPQQQDFKYMLITCYSGYYCGWYLCTYSIHLQLMNEN